MFFDVGETIVDETREYGTWADWLGVLRHTFSAVFGAVIARGGDYRDTFQYFQPGFDLGPSGSAERRPANPRPSLRRTSTPIRAHAWASCSGWGCGSAWPVTRPLVRSGS